MVTRDLFITFGNQQSVLCPGFMGYWDEAFGVGFHRARGLLKKITIRD